MLLPMLQFIESDRDVAHLAASSRLWSVIVEVFGAVHLPISLATLSLVVLTLRLLRQAVAFANAVQIDPSDLERTRGALEACVGLDGMLEAAATIAIFNGLVRVADGTGIQLDDGVVSASADYREDLGVNAFGGAANTVTEGTGPAVDADREITSIRELFV